MSYNVRYIIGVQDSVYIHAVTSAYSGLLQLLTLLNPCVCGAAVVGGMDTVSIVNDRFLVPCGQYFREFPYEFRLFLRVGLSRDLRRFLVSEAYAV